MRRVSEQYSDETIRTLEALAMDSLTSEPATLTPGSRDLRKGHGSLAEAKCFVGLRLICNSILITENLRAPSLLNLSLL